MMSIFGDGEANLETISSEFSKPTKTFVVKPRIFFIRGSK